LRSDEKGEHLDVLAQYSGNDWHSCNGEHGRNNGHSGNDECGSNCGARSNLLRQSCLNASEALRSNVEYDDLKNPAKPILCCGDFAFHFSMLLEQSIFFSSQSF
jgi:hypothetical protein